MEFQEIINELTVKMKDLDKKLDTMKPKSSRESNELDKLFTALAKAQGEMELASKDSSNPFFKSKYSDLASIVRASRESLSKNGLSVIQRVVTNNDGKLYMLTRLCHASGQWLESNMPLTPPKTDIQSLGSYITYVRRYNLASIVGVAPGDDDDGEKAVKDERTITDKQAKEINKLIDGDVELWDIINKEFKYSKITDIKEFKYKEIVTSLRLMKIQSKRKESKNDSL